MESTRSDQTYTRSVRLSLQEAAGKPKPRGHGAMGPRATGPWAQFRTKVSRRGADVMSSVLIGTHSWSMCALSSQQPSAVNKPATVGSQSHKQLPFVCVSICRSHWAPLEPVHTAAPKHSTVKKKCPKNIKIGMKEFMPLPLSHRFLGSSSHTLCLPLFL